MELNATIPALIREQAAAHGGETILRRKDRGIWKALTWSDLDARVAEIGLGLCEAGLAAGETVAILSETRPEQVFADLAVVSCGGVSLAIHPEEDAAIVAAILRDTRPAMAIVEGEEQLDKLLSVRGQCPPPRTIAILDMKGLRDFHDPACVSLADLIARGTKGSNWRATADSIRGDQPAAVLLPRGGGTPMTLTHADILARVAQAAQTLEVRAGDERLAVLPLSDPAERLFGLYLALKTGIVGNYLENPETATENLREVKPTVFGANVEAWERLHARIGGLADAATGVQRALYRWAIASGGGGVANWLVSPAIRAELGFSRLRVAYVGDGTLSPELAAWAKALGITVRHLDMPA